MRTKPSRQGVGRRTFMAAPIAAVAAATTRVHAQDAATKPAGTLKVVDFHNHFVGAAFAQTTQTQRGASAAVRLATANLASPTALLDSLAIAGVAARVINTPTAFLEDADGNVPAGTIPRINDEMAALVSKHPGQLYGLATVDVFSGDAGARELTRAVRDLGLRGVFVESAKGDLLLDAPQARPTLAAAARLRVPVFVHPQTDPQLFNRFSKVGPLGARLARATINSAALISMLEGGVFDELPQLEVVVTTLALGGVMLAGGFGDGQRIRRDTPALMRRHVYVDTMGVHPAAVAACVELLGVDHVLAGTDWPIAVEASVPQRLRAALTAAGVDEAGQQMVASGNTLKLLGVG